MKKAILIIIFLIFAFARAEADIVGKIVAIVNDEIITQAELDMALGLQENSKLSKEQVLENLVVDKLVYCEAKRQNIEADNEEVEERIEIVKSRFPSEEVFLETLKSQNFTITDLRELYKEQIMAKKLIDKNVNSKVRISPRDIAQYYRHNASNFKTPPGLNISKIVIKITPERSEEEARQIISSVKTSLDNGASFEALAKEYSEGTNSENGGIMGYITRGELKKEIEDELFKLEMGEVSEILKLDSGLYIFKVLSKEPERPRDLSEVQYEIRMILYNQEAQKIFDEWVKNLKETAYIHFNGN